MPAKERSILAPAIVEDPPREDGSDRYAIYVVSASRAQKRIAETSLSGIGLALVTLRDEDEITHHSRVGIRDRIEGRWIVNPYGVGDRS